MVALEHSTPLAPPPATTQPFAAVVAGETAAELQERISAALQTINAAGGYVRMPFGVASATSGGDHGTGVTPYTIVVIPYWAREEMFRT